MVVTRTHYEVLGVDSEASLADVKVAYRKRVRATHPDLGGDPREVGLVNHAYAVLSDSNARARYDLGLRTGNTGAGRSARTASSATSQARARAHAAEQAAALVAEKRAHRFPWLAIPATFVVLVGAQYSLLTSMATAGGYAATAEGQLGPWLMVPWDVTRWVLVLAALGTVPGTWLAYVRTRGNPVPKLEGPLVMLAALAAIVSFEAWMRSGWAWAALVAALVGWVLFARLMNWLPGPANAAQWSSYQVWIVQVWAQRDLWLPRRFAPARWWLDRSTKVRS